MSREVSNEILKINSSLSIPSSELTFVSSRSSGPGGQHVNKVSTRITLQFNVILSTSLTDEQRQQIMQKLKTRINRDGMLQISSQASRSQFTNKETVLIRFSELIKQALFRKPVRKKTKISKAVKQRRLDQKKQQSNKKKMRAKKDD